MTNTLLNLHHLINGEWVAGTGESARSTNPAAPDEVVGEYLTATTSELHAALAAATAARSAWDRLGMLGRGLILRKAAGLLEQRAEQIAVLMTREQGKILADARAEIGGTIETLFYHSGAARRPTGVTYPSGNSDEIVRTVRTIHPLRSTPCPLQGESPASNPTSPGRCPWQRGKPLGFGRRHSRRSEGGKRT